MDRPSFSRLADLVRDELKAFGKLVKLPLENFDFLVACGHWNVQVRFYFKAKCESLEMSIRSFEAYCMWSNDLSSDVERARALISVGHDYFIARVIKLRVNSLTSYSTLCSSLPLE